MADQLDYQRPRKRSPNDRRYSMLALVGFPLSVFGPVASCLVVGWFGPPRVPNWAALLLLMTPMAAGAICCTTAFVQAINAEGKLRGGILAMFGALIGYAWIVGIVCMIIFGR